MSLLGDLIAAGGGAALLAKGYEDLGNIGDKAYNEMAGPGGLADKLSDRMEFKPYTVTSATGGQFGMSQGQDGQYNFDLNLSPEEQALQQSQLANAGMFFDQAAMPIADREQEVYNRMRAAMSPEEERQRLQLEERLFNQGRGGLRTSMFGGSPEQLALAKAQEEAKNSAMLQAMQFAGQEQQRYGQMGSGMLASSFVPQAQLISALQPGMTAADQARLAQQGQAQAYGETYATGLEALLQSGLGRSSMLGGAGANILEGALGGLFS
jgi:hypothetical protein